MPRLILYHPGSRGKVNVAASFGQCRACENHQTNRIYSINNIDNRLVRAIDKNVGCVTPRESAHRAGGRQGAATLAPSGVRWLCEYERAVQVVPRREIFSRGGPGGLGVRFNAGEAEMGLKPTARALQTKGVGTVPAAIAPHFYPTGICRGIR